MVRRTVTESVVDECHLDSGGTSFANDKKDMASVLSKTRNRIIDMNKARHNISNTYREILRALRNTLGSLVYVDSEGNTVPVKNIHANPERAVAKIHQQDNTILPITSVSQSVTNNDDTRRRYEPMLVSEKYWDESSQRAIRILSFPARPVNITYDINIWSKYITDLDQLSEQIRLFFNPSLQLATKNNTVIKAFLEEESDEGNMAAGDGTDRLVRRTVVISVEGYIPSPKYLYTSTGKIELFVLNPEIHKYCG